MSPENSVMLAVIMERMILTSKWADHHWEAVGVMPDAAGSPPASGTRLKEYGNTKGNTFGALISY